MRLPLILAAAALVAIPAWSQQPAARGFVVAETGRTYGRLQQAVDALGDAGGTIRVRPGVYRDCAVVERGHVSFVAEAPGQTVFEALTCEDKAVLVLRGRGARVNGIVFRRLQVPDGNGAGIRLEEGDLEVADTMFLDSQGGILTADYPQGRIAIDRTTFAGLGKDPDGNGAHSLYVGHYGSLSVTRSRFERGQGGHYLKSRVPQVEIAGNSFDDSRGVATNYMIDLSNGATGRIAGNSFAQGPNKENYATLIAVAPEGPDNSSDGLAIEGNRAWLSPGFRHSTTLVGNWSRDRVSVRDNELAERVRAYVER